jgi:RNA polymerase sigma-70 factor (sigma-E family)
MGPAAVPETAVDEQLVALFRREYPAMIGVAALLVGSRAAAEDLVQEAFVRLLLKWDRLREPEKAGAYLRTTVLNLARGRLRRDRTAQRHARTLRVVTDSPEDSAFADAEHTRVMAALAELPRRQRECAVLRYYLELSDGEIAAALGVAAGSVKSHLHRARAALEVALEER